jgi:uncharacterized membrane protein YdjX (TVP38/TMEM64 family)
LALRITIAVVAVAAIVAAWRAGLFSIGDRERLLTAIDNLRGRPGLEVSFVVAYAVLSAIGVPATPLTLAGGALFGVVGGIALNWLGELLGAVLAFGGVRLVAGNLVERSPRAARIAERLSAGNTTLLLFRLRLVPVAPFALLNIGSALSGMSWRAYLVATAPGIIPVTAVYTIFAASLLDGAVGSARRALIAAAGSGAAIVSVTMLARRRR